jgi:hypothetical protein
MRTYFKIIVILIEIISSQLLFSQNTEYKYYGQNYISLPRTDSLYEKGEHRESIKFNLLRTDSLENLIPQANYVIAQDYALLNMPDSAFFYLNQYLDFGAQDYRSVYIDEDFEELRKNKTSWNAIIARIEDIYFLELDSTMNKKLALKLFHIGIEELRIGFTPASCRRKSFPTPVACMKHNLKSQKEVKKIIRRNGLPTPSMVGATAANVAWDIIQHSTIEDKHYYLIKEAYEKGDYNPEYYALTTDRWLVQNGRKQIYGTQFYKNNSDGIIKMNDVEDFKNINKRRAEVGLGTIEEYAKKMNGVIPEEYYH